MRASLLVLVAVVALAITAEAIKPSAWRLLSRSPKATDPVSFTFALKQRNIEVLEKTVLEISDPTNPKYSNWLSREEILDLIAPPAEVPLKYISWVQSECAGFPTTITNLGDAVKVVTNVACAEKLLGIKAVIYEHKKSGIKVVRRHLDGALPVVREDLAAHLEFVSGISQLPVVRQPKAEAVNFVTRGAALDYVIPATSRALYNIPPKAKATNPRNSQSAIEFTPEGAPLISDMVSFAQQAGETFTNISKIVGPFDVGNNGESILDVEYLTTLGTGAYTWYITIEGWIYDFALTLFNTPNPPLVNSVSYGWPEEDQCNSVTNSNCTGITTGQYVAKANNELLKVAGLGLSVLVASQDEGAPSEANEDCSLDDSHPLWPIYPAASPWVTAVSGTTLIGGGTIASPPAICNQGYTCGSGSGAIEHPCMPNETYYQWTTGGGFSKYAPMPSWQSAAVKKYLSSSALIPPTQWFTAQNRGYPDISGLGARILTIQSGSLAVTAGTSAATPIIAGIITLLNDYRLNAGKKQLGFLNPMLYQAAAVNPATFNTINAGNNKGTIGVVCTYGYGCWNGWSPVTGLGSPNYVQLLNFIKTLP